VPKSSHVFEHEIEIVGIWNLHHKCFVTIFWLLS